MAGAKIFAYVSNYTLLEQFSETLFIPANKSSWTKAGAVPFVAILGIKPVNDEKFSPNLVELYLNEELKGKQPSRVFISEGTWYSCRADFDGHDWGTRSKVVEAKTVDIPAAGGDRDPFFCMHFVYDVPTPHPASQFSLSVGRAFIDSPQIKDVQIYFSPRKVRWIQTH